jgi:hypothetical protein
MATLASSMLLGASNTSCAAEEGFLSTSEPGKPHATAPCSCKLKGSGFHLPSSTFAGNEHSWLRSGRSSAWSRSNSGDVFAGFRHRLGRVNAGTAMKSFLFEWRV